MFLWSLNSKGKEERIWKKAAGERERERKRERNTWRSQILDNTEASTNLSIQISPNSPKKLHDHENLRKVLADALMIKKAM